MTKKLIFLILMIFSSSTFAIQKIKMTKTLNSDLNSSGKHWIRNFSKENGGGHVWEPKKMQSFNKKNFDCLNWDICDPKMEICLGRTCSHPLSPDCKQRTIVREEEKHINDFMGSLELLGISNVYIKTNDAGFDSDLLGAKNEKITCHINPQNLDKLAPPTIASTGAKMPIPDTIMPLLVDGSNADYIDPKEPNKRMYSAANLKNFINKKKVFSKNKFSSCLPNGHNAGPNVSSRQCCSGVKNYNGICCMRDFSNLSVYYNRNVSSELKNLDKSLFDEKTGFMKSPNILESILISKNPCCSGQPPIRGVAVSNLQVQGFPGSAHSIRRFIVSDAAEDSTHGVNALFDAGARWNTHLYCSPQGYDWKK